MENKSMYLLNLKTECRKYFEETCVIENRSRRNEHAINLAIKIFCQRFDKMFGLSECNQDKIQDFTGDVDIESEVDPNASASPSGFWSRKFADMIWSAQDGLKEEEFDKLLPIALKDATKVLKSNAIVNNDDDLKKLSERSEKKCT
ncbi:unnamed protein product [Allacma fusca]|uniref:Uncharacterized protein n=1 Tax=Allacma fusca TaxID=39272 RepID=A0A8J2K7D1_9HEXA|nr:unnamed protein product [Allacma fusca]